MKGGKESTETCKALLAVFQASLEKADIPKDAVQMLTTRDEIRELLALDGLVDLIIPRGSNSLVRLVFLTNSIIVK